MLGETLLFLLLCFIYVSCFTYGTLILIYIKRLFMVYIFYFMFCEIKKFIMFYLYFPYICLCVCLVFQKFLG